MTIKHFNVFCILVIINGIASVSIAGVPLQWVGIACGLVVGSYFFSRVKGLNGPLIVPLAFLLFGVMVLNLANWQYFQGNFPSAATTPYSVFIALRYLNIFSFIAIVVIVSRLCQTGNEPRVLRFLVNLGGVVACYAIYVFVAQTYGLPELFPRSRLGTGGGEQATTFSYAFHRAMGPFREPSHLAEWLMMPFALSFINKPRSLKLPKLLMGLVILMTGSMTAIMALAIAFPLAFGIVYWRLKRIRLSWWLLKELFGGVAFFSVLTIGTNWALSGRLFETIYGRTREIIDGGMAASNRSYVYEYLAGMPLSLFGDGLGNANIAFSLAIDNRLISSLLSIYFNMLYSAGVIGFSVFIVVLLYPLFRVLVKKNRENGRAIFLITWSYIAWLVDFGVHSEELTIMFGISYALLFFNTQRIGPRNLNKPISGESENDKKNETATSQKNQPYSQRLSFRRGDQGLSSYRGGVTAMEGKISKLLSP